jgi:membrane protein
MQTKQWLTSRATLVRDVVLETYTAWREDRTLRLGAGLAYYALFAIVPLLALTAALAERLFSTIAMKEFLSDRLAQLSILDPDAAGGSIADELARRSVQSSLGIVGLGGLLFTSSLVFMALVDAVNTIWNVPVSTGIRSSIRRRLISFLMVLTTGAIMISNLAISAISGAAEKLIPGNVEILGTLANLIASLASGAALVVALVLLFRYTGPVRSPWPATIVSAVTTSALLVVGTGAISWYLRTLGGSSLTGAFGALLVSLSWVYYEAQILLAGLQLVKVLTRRNEAIVGAAPRTT